MTTEIIVEGDDITLETTEVITEVITEGLQGPAGPPGIDGEQSGGVMKWTTTNW